MEFNGLSSHSIPLNSSTFRAVSNDDVELSKIPSFPPLLEVPGGSLDRNLQLNDSIANAQCNEIGSCTLSNLSQVLNPDYPRNDRDNKYPISERSRHNEVLESNIKCFPSEAESHSDNVTGPVSDLKMALKKCVTFDLSKSSFYSPPPNYLQNLKTPLSLAHNSAMSNEEGQSRLNLSCSSTSDIVALDMKLKPPSCSTENSISSNTSLIPPAIEIIPTRAEICRNIGNITGGTAEHPLATSNLTNVPTPFVSIVSIGTDPVQNLSPNSMATDNNISPLLMDQSAGTSIVQCKSMPNLPNSISINDDQFTDELNPSCECKKENEETKLNELEMDEDATLEHIQQKALEINARKTEPEFIVKQKSLCNNFFNSIIAEGQEIEMVPSSSNEIQANEIADDSFSMSQETISLPQGLVIEKTHELLQPEENQSDTSEYSKLPFNNVLPIRTSPTSSYSHEPQQVGSGCRQDYLNLQYISTDGCKINKDGIESCDVQKLCRTPSPPAESSIFEEVLLGRNTLKDENMCSKKKCAEDPLLSEIVCTSVPESTNQLMVDINGFPFDSLHDSNNTSSSPPDHNGPLSCERCIQQDSTIESFRNSDLADNYLSWSQKPLTVEPVSLEYQGTSKTLKRKIFDSSTENELRERLDIAGKEIEMLRNQVLEHKRQRRLLVSAMTEEAAKQTDEQVKQAKIELSAQLESTISEATVRAQAAIRMAAEVQANMDNEDSSTGDFNSSGSFVDALRQKQDKIVAECHAEVKEAAEEMRRKWAIDKRSLEDVIKEEFQGQKDMLVVMEAMRGEMAEERRVTMETLRREIQAECKDEFLKERETLRSEIEAEFEAKKEKSDLLGEVRLEIELEELRSEILRLRSESRTAENSSNNCGGPIFIDRTPPSMGTSPGGRVREAFATPRSIRPRALLRRTVVMDSSAVVAPSPETGVPADGVATDESPVPTHPLSNETPSVDAISIPFANSTQVKPFRPPLRSRIARASSQPEISNRQNTNPTGKTRSSEVTMSLPNNKNINGDFIIDEKSKEKEVEKSICLTGTLLKKGSNEKMLPSSQPVSTLESAASSKKRQVPPTSHKVKSQEQEKSGNIIVNSQKKQKTQAKQETSLNITAGSTKDASEVPQTLRKKALGISRGKQLQQAALNTQN